MDGFASLSTIAQHWSALLVAASATVGHFLVEPMRWRIYLRPAVRTDKLIAVFFSAAFLSYFLPLKLGLAFRFGLLVRYLHRSSAQVAGLIAFDGFLYYVVFGLAGAGAALFLGHRLTVPTQLAAFLCLALLAALAIGLIIRRRRRASPSIPTLATNWRDVLPDMGGRQWLGLSSLLALDLAGHAIRHAALLAALGAPPLPLDISLALPIFAVVAGMFSLTPMGLGGYEVALTAGLLAAGLPVEIALQLAVTNRVLSLSVALLGGGVASVKLGLDWRALVPKKRT